MTSFDRCSVVCSIGMDECIDIDRSSVKAEHLAAGGHVVFQRQKALSTPCILVAAIEHGSEIRTGTPFAVSLLYRYFVRTRRPIGAS